MICFHTKKCENCDKAVWWNWISLKGADLVAHHYKNDKASIYHNAGIKDLITVCSSCHNKIPRIKRPKQTKIKKEKYKKYRTWWLE